MRFIVFEGLDGSGKSTLINGLKEELMQSNIDFLISREPGGTELGEKIRNLLLTKEEWHPVPRAEILLYEASRAQHVDKVIEPALKQGTWVLCDRFTASTVAFQAGGRNISRNKVDILNDFATANLKPDLTVLIDIPVEFSQKRVNKRTSETGQKKDRFESENFRFHEAIRTSYLEQAHEKKSEWLVIDGTLTKEEILNRLIQFLKDKRWLIS